MLAHMTLVFDILLSKWSLLFTTRDKGTHILLVLNYSQFHSTASCFRVTGHFETIADIDPENNIAYYKIKGFQYRFHQYPKILEKTGEALITTTVVPVI